MRLTNAHCQFSSSFVCLYLCIISKSQQVVFPAVQTLCALLDCLLTPENIPADAPRELYETYFTFACIWAFGGALLQDQVLLCFNSNGTVQNHSEVQQYMSNTNGKVKFNLRHAFSCAYCIILCSMNS